MLGLRPVVSGYHQLDRTLEEAAQVAGARLLRRLRTIIAPLVAPAAAAGALLIFLTAFNELTVSALLWSTGSETLGVVFFSFQQGGDSTYAAALGALTILVSFVAHAVDAAVRTQAAARGAAMARLTLERLSKSFGPTRVLDDVSLAVQRRRAGGDPGTVRLRQDDAAAPGRGLRQARPRAHPDRRRRGVGTARCTYRPSAGASASCSSRTRCGRT